MKNDLTTTIIALSGFIIIALIAYFIERIDDE